MTVVQILLSILLPLLDVFCAYGVSTILLDNGLGFSGGTSLRVITSVLRPSAASPI